MTSTVPGNDLSLNLGQGEPLLHLDACIYWQLWRFTVPQATAQSCTQCLLCWYNDIEIIITSEDLLTWAFFWGILDYFRQSVTNHGIPQQVFGYSVREICSIKQIVSSELRSLVSILWPDCWCLSSSSVVSSLGANLLNISEENFNRSEVSRYL